MISVTSKNIVIENLVVDGNKSARDGSRPYPGGDVVDGMVVGFYARNMIVRFCEARNGIEDGIGCWQNVDTEVYGCSSHDNGTPQATSVGIAISGPDNRGARVFDNDIFNNFGGIWLAYGASDILVEGNTIWNNVGPGITTGGHDLQSTVLSTNISILDNVLSGNGSAGFAALVIVSAQNGFIGWNTIVDNFVGLQFDDQGTIPSSQWIVVGNECSNTNRQRKQVVGIRVIGGLSNSIHLEGNACRDNGTSLLDQIFVLNPLAVNPDWPLVNTISYTSP